MAQSARRSYSDSIGHLSVRALGDNWSATPADDDSRRAVLSGHASSLVWHDAQVPGEWRSHSAFADHAGAVLYRVHLSQPRPAAEQRTWIVSEGIFEQADIWLDGAYVGDQDDYFLRHSYDVTELCRLDEQHEVIVEVNGTDHAGMWAPLTVKTTGAVAIGGLRVLCRDASDSRAHLRLSADLDAHGRVDATVRTLVDDVLLSEKSLALSSGINRAAWTVDVVNPRLWWPASLGDQALSSVVVEVVVDGAVSDRHETTTGFREVSMTQWILTVNGERLYAKGAFVDLADTDLGEVTDDIASRPIRVARDLGLDIVRLRHHVAHPRTYAAADQLGVMLWQDLPSHPRGKRGRRMAARWADGLVAQLGHHPSIVMWHHDALDRAAHRAFTSADDTRPVMSHASTSVPAVVTSNARLAPLREFVAGIGYDMNASLAVVPNLGRFPTDEQWKLVRPALHDAAAAHVLRRDIETLRRLKYTPGAGFCFPSLRDESVLSSHGALDASHNPQPAFYALADACRPVIVVGTELPPITSPNDEFAFHVHVVSDVRIPLANARVVATITSDDGQHEREWQGDIDADGVTYIATMNLQIPECDGLYTVDLQVEAGDYTATNTYVSSVTSGQSETIEPA